MTFRGLALVSCARWFCLLVLGCSLRWWFGLVGFCFLLFGWVAVIRVLILGGSTVLVLVVIFVGGMIFRWGVCLVVLVWLVFTAGF